MTNRKSSGYRPDQRRRGLPEGYRIDGRRKRKSPEEYRPNYRWLADQCRQAAGTAPEQERADLLARAKLWDFLAEHPPAASSSELNE
jgi:hypothetical protein